MSTFPIGWPPRPASSVRSVRFFISGTATANFSENAYLFTSGNKAYATIGGVDVNGIVLANADTAGAIGNLFTIEVIIPAGGPNALSAIFDPNDATRIIVSLATLASGAPDGAANTATLVAAAVNALAGITAVVFGTGNTALTQPEIRKNFFGGGSIVTPTPNISHGATTTAVRVGNSVAPGSPMGTGQGPVSVFDPYSSPEPMVWANTILVSNDDGTATNTLEFSFDGINVHGRVRGGETLTFRERREAGIAIRLGAGTPAFRIHAW